MRLSEAMLLGSTTCKMIPGDWSSCALGAAANAVGIANSHASARWQEEFAELDGSIRTIFHPAYEMPDGRTRRDWIEDRWPWLRESADLPLMPEIVKRNNTSIEVRWACYPTTNASLIFGRFDILVCQPGNLTFPDPSCQPMTFEQLVDFVRSIEPECGECNRFECTCGKKAESATTIAATTEEAAVAR